MRKTRLKSKTPLRAKTPIRRVSDKQKRIIADERKIANTMIEECKGRCMICGKVARLEKNHTRDRKGFIMSCHECHFPNGYHKYLDN